MQRRAAAAYVVLFVLIAAGSYAFIATAQSPTVTIEDPDHTLSEDGTTELTVDGRTYELAEVASEKEEGGHGGGGGVSYTAKLEWTNESAISSESFENGGEVELENTTYQVVIPNESDPGSATLREQPGDDVETVERDGQTFVVVQNDQDNDELVPIEEYEALDRIQITDGEQFDYQGEDAEVGITNESVTFSWNEPQTNEVELNNEANVTLNGQQYFVFIEDGERVLLTTNYGSYSQQVDEIDRFEQRMNGFWGVTILAGIAAVLLTGLAYLPHKDT